MYNFTIAKPIFIKDKSLEMNFQAGFVCAFDAQKDKSYTLNITGSTYYRITLNGKFLSYGPARPPHGRPARGRNTGSGCRSWWTR